MEQNRMAWRGHSSKRSHYWEQSSAVVDPPNLGVQLKNRVTELCVLCTAILGLEIYGINMQFKKQSETLELVSDPHRGI